MNKKLFLVCPDCHLENYIEINYGIDVLFLTALGAVFNFNEINYTEAVMDLIPREGISDIFVVNDTSCRFIKSILERENGFGTACETVIQNILIDNYSAVMHGKSLPEKKKHLAELNVKRQVKEILTNELFLQRIIQNNVCIKGLVLTKEDQIINEYG